MNNPEAPKGVLWTEFRGINLNIVLSSCPRRDYVLIKVGGEDIQR